METTIYTAEKHPGVVVVEVHGDVDCGECGLDRLCGLLHNLVDGGDLWMVVDLRGAGVVHERALAEILAVLGRLRLRGGNLIMVAPPGELLKSIRTIGFHELTLVLDDVETAVQQAAREAQIGE
ncbi:MAG: STAS domain-containing protein [Armatimonadota bacterium]